MKSSVLALAIISVFAVPPSLAGFDIDQATTHTADCSAPAVASSADGLTMVAYVADGDPLLMSFTTALLVPTNPAPGEIWPEPVTLNAGGSPAICWTREGFVMAFASGGMILVYQSDLEGNWNLGDFVMLDPGGAVMGIDLWGVPTEAAGPYVFMTVQVSTNPPDDDFKVLYAAGSLLGWTGFEVVAEEPTQEPHPQVSWSFGPAGPWPTIFYLTDATGAVELVYKTKNLAAGWTIPVAVPGDGASAPTPIDGEFAVVTHGPLVRNILGLGPQPVCPCRTIHHLSYDTGSGWSPQEDLTVNHNVNDWPMSPCLGIDHVGRAHALWVQVGSGSDLEPKTRTLEYWIKTDGGWQEVGGFLDGQEGGPLGERVALDVSPTGNVVLAWTRRDTLGGVPQSQQVWIARQREPSDVPGSEVPRSAVALSARPNPFNPTVRLAMEAPVSGPASLDIFDLRGRLLVRLFDGFLPAGLREMDWNGRDAAGRSVPSGVYFARLETTVGRAVQKLVLTE